MDTAATEKKAREFLQSRFEACYPFHPATLSVFQRKWSALTQFQATRGTLAMLAQWISIAGQDAFRKARTEPLITLGSAPLHDSAFQSVVLGQLGENRLNTAIDTDISGGHSHAKALDADTRGALRDIHRRAGSAILFESSGGQRDKVAHLPELRFALGEPGLDTTSIDNAAIALESKSFFIQRVGADGFKIFHKAKIDKAVHDRRASLDESSEIRPAIRDLVKEEFKRGASIPVEYFPADSTAVSDSPRLSLVVVDPADQWDGDSSLRDRIADWTKNRGTSSRLYPGALVWCVRKPGRDLRDKVELWLAWKRVQKDVRDGVLGADYEKADLREIEVKVSDAEEQAKDEVWGGYRFAGARRQPRPKRPEGNRSGGWPLQRPRDAVRPRHCGDEGRSPVERVGGRRLHRPELAAGVQGHGCVAVGQPSAELLNGALTRLLDPDTVLRAKILEFIGRGDFGLASGPKADGTYERVWFRELAPSDEVAFEPGVLLVKKDKAEALKRPPAVPTPEGEIPKPEMPGPESGPGPGPEPTPPLPTTTTIRVSGNVPPELWNRLGTRVLPKLRAGDDLKIGVSFEVSVNSASAGELRAELRQIVEDLGLGYAINIE